MDQKEFLSDVEDFKTYLLEELQKATIRLREQALTAGVELRGRLLGDIAT